MWWSYLESPSWILPTPKQTTWRIWLGSHAKVTFSWQGQQIDFFSTTQYANILCFLWTWNFGLFFAHLRQAQTVSNKAIAGAIGGGATPNLLPGFFERKTFFTKILKIIYNVRTVIRRCMPRRKWRVGSALTGPIFIYTRPVIFLKITF